MSASTRRAPPPAGAPRAEGTAGGSGVGDDTGRPLLLLSNDDGYSADGLVALQRALSAFADVVVCAPEINQSATSHSLSLHRALRLRHVSATVHAVDGTPADCVYVALHSGTRVLRRRPDLVVSGMNHGLNLGNDVYYSGTVAAAREAAIRGIPAMAVSADRDADPAAAAALATRLARSMFEEHARRSAFIPAAGASGLDPDASPPDPRPTSRVPLLNVNIPPGRAWDVRATRLGVRLYQEDVIYREDPRGKEYLWIGGSGVRHHDTIPGSDTEAYDAGVVSVTPLALDLWGADHTEIAERVSEAGKARG